MSKRAEFSQLDEADSGSDDDGSVYDSEESDASQDSVERKEAAIKRKMNKLKAQKESVVDDADTLGRNAAIELAHQKKMIAFAPRWLISPFVPLIMSLANIVGGSIIMNVTNVSECTEPLNSALALRVPSCRRGVRRWNRAWSHSASARRLADFQSTSAASFSCRTCT